MRKATKQKHPFDVIDVDEVSERLHQDEVQEEWEDEEQEQPHPQQQRQQQQEIPSSRMQHNTATNLSARGQPILQDGEEDQLPQPRQKGSSVDTELTTTTHRPLHTTATNVATTAATSDKITPSLDDGTTARTRSSADTDTSAKHDHKNEHNNRTSNGRITPETREVLKTVRKLEEEDRKAKLVSSGNNSNSPSQVGAHAISSPARTRAAATNRAIPTSSNGGPSSQVGARAVSPAIDSSMENIPRTQVHRPPPEVLQVVRNLEAEERQAKLSARRRSSGNNSNSPSQVGAHAVVSRTIDSSIENITGTQLPRLPPGVLTALRKSEAEDQQEKESARRCCGNNSNSPSQVGAHAISPTFDTSLEKSIQTQLVPRPPGEAGSAHSSMTLSGKERDAAAPDGDLNRSLLDILARDTQPGAYPSTERPPNLAPNLLRSPEPSQYNQNNNNFSEMDLSMSMSGSGHNNNQPSHYFGLSPTPSQTRVVSPFVSVPIDDNHILPTPPLLSRLDPEPELMTATLVTATTPSNVNPDQADLEQARSPQSPGFSRIHAPETNPQSQNMRDGSMNDTSNGHGMQRRRQEPVVHAEEPVVHAEESGIADFLKNRAFCFFFTGYLCAVATIAALIVVIVVMQNQNDFSRTNPRTVFETDSESRNPNPNYNTQEAVLSMTITLMDEYIDEDNYPAQYEAWKWLGSYPNLIGLSRERKVQLYALMTFFHSFNGMYWPAFDRSSYADPDKDECLWGEQYSSENYDPNNRREVTNIVADIKEAVYGNGNSVDSGSDGSLTACKRGQGILTQLQLVGESDYTIRNVQGTMPREVSFLSSLDMIHISYTTLNARLSDLLPLELSRLVNLTTINFSENQIQGTIPPVNIAHMQKLTSLQLQSNRITGTIPPDLGLLTRLTSIQLQGNQFRGTVPFRELGNLRNLKELQLWNNQLHGNVDDLPNLAQLTLLTVHNNDFSGSLPTELGSLQQLTMLRLWGNNFSGWVPSELGLMSSLRFLDLHENRFSGPVPSELGRLTALEELRLYGNDWSEVRQMDSTIPSELCALPNLKVFRVDCSILACPMSCANCECYAY